MLDFTPTFQFSTFSASEIVLHHAFGWILKYLLLKDTEQVY